MPRSRVLCGPNAGGDIVEKKDSERGGATWTREENFQKWGTPLN